MMEIEDYIYYLIEHYQDIELLRQAYPDILFLPLLPLITSIAVPKGMEQEVEKIRAEVATVVMPTLFGLNSREALRDANILQLHNYPYSPLRGEGTLVAIIDTGIDYTNPLFKYEDNTTRIVSLWDQTVSGEGVIDYPYGTEYTSEQINEALRSQMPYTIVPSTDRIGHGTFLAGVAAGYDRQTGGTYTGGAPEAGLVIVKLRETSSYLREFYMVDESVPAYSNVAFMHAVNYVIGIARRESKPISICVSIGGNDGGHDGRTITENFLDDLSMLQGVVFNLSAGNEANLAHHYSGQLAQNGEKTLELNVAQGEPGFIMQLWANSPDKMSMGITSPLGQKIERLPTNISTPEIFKIPLENTTIILSYTFAGLDIIGQRIEIRLINPTPGLWQFTVYGDFVIDGNYNIWLPRKDFIFPDTRFLQADAFTTVNIPATETDVIVVGAYEDANQSIYAASGRGPTRNNVIKPDIIAPGVNVLGPSVSGGFTMYTGTSVAAAITTAASALLLQWGILNGNLPKINTRVAKGVYIRGARRTPGVVYPNPIEGYGKLDLQNSLLLSHFWDQPISLRKNKSEG